MKIDKSHIFGICSMLFVLMAMVSCKPGIPDEYIQPDDMEDILYDYHIAMAMANQGNTTDNDAKIVAYKKAVLKKHGVSEGQMEKSMRYYARHTEELHDIYDDLSERLNDEAKELGANSATIASTGNMTQNGDTTDVWTGSRAMVLSPNVGSNSFSFAMKCDSSFHKGDRISLEFNSTYIIQEGTRNAVAVMAITLGNDSIVTQTLHITSDSHQILSMGDFTNLGIKSIKGYILFPPDNSMMASTTMKILCISNFALIRMHIDQPKVKNGGQQAKDSIGNDSANKPASQGIPANGPSGLSPMTIKKVN